MLSDITTVPKITANYAAAIQPANFKQDLDSYLAKRSPVTFLAEIRGHLQISNEPGSRYNIPLMNALVLYVGNQAISQIRWASYFSYFFLFLNFLPWIFTFFLNIIFTCQKNDKKS